MFFLIGLILTWLLTFRIVGNKVNFFHLMLVYWSFQCIAVSNIADSSESPAAQFFLLCILFWLVGAGTYFFIWPYRQVIFHQAQSPKFPSLDRLCFGIFFFLILIVTAYHYVVGGVPLLSESLKIDAFNNTRSGFFGIPGRVANWGPIILVITAFVYKHSFQNRRHKFSWLIYAATILCLVSLVANGHKSGVVVVAQVIILSIAYSNSALTVAPRDFLRWCFYGVLVLVSIYLLAVNILSGSLNNTEIVDRLIVRIFEISGRPFEFVFNDYIWDVPPGFGAYLFDDFGNVLSKIGLASVQMNTSEKVSFALHGGTLWNNTTVPTTINIFGRSLIEVGKFGTIIFAFIFGVLCSFLLRLGASRRTVVGRVTVILAQYSIFILGVKGNPVYSMSSMIFGIIFVGILFLGARFFPMLAIRQV